MFVAVWNAFGPKNVHLPIPHTASLPGTIDLMNTCSAVLVRVIILLLSCAWSLDGMAQGKDALTKDFDKLSPKERSRIAARETREAATDSSYQAVMRDAEQAFQDAQYEDALKLFQQARVLRPYNVYPKVKIEDLQALIKKRDRDQAAQGAAPEPIPPAPVQQEVSEEAPPSPAPAPTPSVVPAPGPATDHAPVPVPPPSPAPLPEVAPAPIPSPEPSPPRPKAPAHTVPVPEKKLANLGERVYIEAGAVVTERTVDDEGKAVTYRKVVHSWGQTYYFKEGLAISQYQWDKRFSE
jgi:hypothetical protein